MRMMMPPLAGALALAALLAVGCGDDADNSPQAPDPAPEAPVYNTLVYSFDDSINQTYTADDGLAWKGAFAYDQDAGILAPDPLGGGPFPLLHDDGPVAAGGHEAEGETADDHRWTVAVLVAAAEADWTFDHWPIVGSVDGADGSLPWADCGGSFTVPAGQNPVLRAEGPAWIPAAAGVTPVCFAIDDSASPSYDVEDGLAWKGSFSYSPTTRRLAFNGSWGGPFPLLYDDGPWTEGGHEGLGHAAGDHVWSVLVYVDNAQTQNWEYGAISGSVNGSDGSWIWSGSNGYFTSPAGRTTQLDAEGLVLPAWGTIDLLVTMDLSAGGANLAEGWTGTDWTAGAALRGNFTGWSQVALTARPEIGEGVYGVLLSDVAGPHAGLLHSGDVLDWLMVLGGTDYRVGELAADQGVAVSFISDGIPSGGVAIGVQPDGDRNLTCVTP